MRSLQDSRARRQERCFLVEGVILVADALAAGAEPRLVLYDIGALQASRRGRALLDDIGRFNGEDVSASVLQSISETVTPQGIVAAFPIAPTPATLPAGGLVVVLDGLRDPGNVGTILRSAEAGGCTAIVTTSDTVDLYSPKVVRAAMGAHFRLPLVYDLAWSSLATMLRGRAIYLAEARGGVPYYDVDWTQPAALIIGNETEGPRPEARRCAMGRVSIPMPGRAESLNAAIAASVIIFEAVRQQQMHKGA